MSNVTFPLRTNQRGETVAELHAALDALIARDALMADDRDARANLLSALATERERSRFGATTRRLIVAFQAEHNLESTGVVDEPTAKAINSLLDNGRPASGAAGARREIGVLSVALRQGMTGPDVMVVQEILTGLGWRIAPWERSRRYFGESTRAAVLAWQKRNGFPPDGVIDDNAFAVLLKEGADLPRSVRGTIRLTDGAPAAGLRVVAVDRDFRSEQPLGEAITDAEGGYRIAYTANAFTRLEKGAADIGLRIFSANGETALSEPLSADLLMNAPMDAVLDATVTAPEGAVLSLFERIGEALRPLVNDTPFGEIGVPPRLDEAIFLARETGFDIGEIAHFIVAYRLEAMSGAAAVWFFALLREDGLYGVGAGRPRVQRTPVGLESDTRIVLYEAVRLDSKLADAAVIRAVRKRIVPPIVLKEIEPSRERLRRFEEEAAKYGDGALRERISKTVEDLLARGKAAEIAKALTSLDPDDIAGIFDQIDARGAFAPEDRDTARVRLDLGAMLDFDLGLIREATAQTARSSGAARQEDVRALARLNVKDWTDHIMRSTGAGKTSKGARTASVERAQARRQAAAIAGRFEMRFPTVAAAAQLGRAKSSALPAHQAVAAFLDAHPALELRDHKLVPFMKQEGIDAAAVAPELRRGLESLQRVLRLTGTYGKSEALVAAGYSASADIAAAGKTQFLADIRRTGGIPAREAKKIFELAENNNLATVQLAANLRTLSWPGALAGDTAKALSKHIDQIVADQPDLEALFGETGACACEHCRSIYGPAAYFADVMRFLRDRLVKKAATPNLPSTRAAKDVLFARRPDLGEMDLDCNNALIEVPHIDIVCELAEEAIAPDAGFAFNGAIAAGAASPALLTAVRAQYAITDNAIIYGPYAANRFILRDETIVLAIDGPGPIWTLRRLRQTHGSAEERAAAPEYVNADAYQLLRSGKAAFGLPFDLFHIETRAFLAAAGINRVELMAALAVGGVPGATVIAAEALGLSDAERQLIFTAAVADQPAIWAVAGITAAPQMRMLDVFTRRSGLDYRGVEALIAGRYVRGAVNLFIRHLDNSCNLSAKEIINLDDTVLDRMHRLLRLAHRTGLAVQDIDRLAAAPRLGGNDLGDPAQRALADLAAVSADLGVGIDRLISWLDVIPTQGDPSAHASLFENPAVTGPLTTDLSAAALRANDAAPAAAPLLSTANADLAITLGARLADIDAMIARLGTLNGAPPRLVSTMISALYARLGLARALGLDIERLLTLEALAGGDPLASTQALLAFVRTARAVIATDVPIAEIAYRLSRVAPDLAARDLADAPIAATLADIRTRLLAAQAENISPFDASLAPSEQVEALERQLARQPQLTETTIAALSLLVRDGVPTAADGALAKAIIDAAPDAASDAGLAGLVDGPAVKAAIDALVALPGAAERNAYLNLLMGGLSASTIQRLSDEIARTATAALFAAPPERATAILDGARLLVAAVATPLNRLFTTGDIVNPAVVLSAAGAPDLFRAARLGHAIAGLLAPFDPDAKTVSFLFARATSLGWMALDSIPFETGVAPVPLASWLELVDALALVEEFPPTDVPTQPGTVIGALDLFGMAASGAAKADLLDGLAIATGWRRALLDDVDTRLALNVAAYRQPATWNAVRLAVGLLNQLNVPLAEAVAFIQPVLGDAERRSARRMLSARYDPADWLGALKNIMDPIREAKRDALIAYLMADNPQLTSTADLYDHFLTDVKWSAKMPSSRLVHAHGTLQLFIQRCIAGLEPDAVADLDGDQAWKWWDWMRNYRVWEVGRKVFVEAQYYLRPEWRDDKTEPFQAMESALLQNEINQENLEAAYEGYLDELDRIAFLDVLATCYDFDREQLHVFGCTKGGDPRSYFHRTLERERVWTPWTRIDLDITGEHLVAFFRNKRLYLAWATFLEKGDEQQDTVFPEPGGSGAQPLPETYRWTEIKLAVSEYTGKKWLPRRVSEDAIKTPSRAETLNLQYVFLTVTPGEKFTVDICLSDDGMRRIGSFLLTGCKGYPEVVQSGGYIYLIPQFEDTAQRGQRLVEQDVVGDERMAMTSVFGGSGFQTLFGETPGIFRIIYPYQASEIDKLLNALMNWAYGSFSRDRQFLFFGTMMPFFFEDNRHGYVLIPGFYGRLDPETGTRTTVKTFSNVRRLLIDVIALIVKYLTLWAQATTPEEQQAVSDAYAADPEVARIAAEFESYRDTQFGYVVRNFYHPLACFLREKFFEGGIPALLARKTQLEVGSFLFESASPGYDPDPIILPPYPRVELEFGRESAYGAYNWELALHGPHMIASKLIEAERFDEAEVWLRYVFDPLGSSNDPSPKRYWNTKPFYQRDPAEYGDQLITAIMDRLANDPTGAVETELADAVWEWRNNPFKPYLVARSRTVAFQQAIVYLTIRVFIGRGDQYFRRDQLEDLVMASLDYSRAERLLGPRPAIVPHAITPPPETYNQLEMQIDLFGNALRKLENLLPDLSVLPQDGAELPPPPLTLESLYFCIPPSEKMYELWDLLEERQFNLRNSRTIDGVERSLSIFAPPLSVEELIKASAAGLSISSILSSLSAPRPPYRFRVMLRHAIELTELAAAFSQKMEAALGSRDTEGLARLKAEQEIRMLDEQTKRLAEEVKIAGGNISSARKARQIHLETKQFYESRPYMNAWEIAATVANGISFGLQAVVAIGYAASGGLALVPSFMIGAAGFGGSPTANAQTGGKDYSSSARDFVVGAVGALASAFDKAAGMLDKQATYLVRQQDWDHSAKMAQREVEHSDIEIVIAQIRETIAKEDLRLHGVRQEQAAAELTYLESKFTNRELFEWLTGQLRGLSRQMFNLAFEAAKAAERCYNYELGTTESFIRAGQWNDTRRGLLAAENLAYDLRRMESAQLKANAREREMTKQVSLARLDPLALLELRTTGRCVIQLPEALFDLDHPGQYFRRFKMMSVLTPCVAGPYSSVPLKLTQINNRVRISTAKVPGAMTDADAYAEAAGNDTRFKYNVGSIQSIEISRGDGDDGGVFALDLNDERYLPFEGSGLCCAFVTELPPTLRGFDAATISDVVLNIRYTARDGGGSFRTMVANGLMARLNAIVLKSGRVGLFHAIDLRRDRPDVWHRLVTTGAASLTVSAGDLPYFTSRRTVAITASRVLARVSGAPASYGITIGGAPVTLNAPPEAELAGLLSSSVAGVAMDAPVALTVPQPSQVEDMVVIVNYSIS